MPDPDRSLPEGQDARARAIALAAATQNLASTPDASVFVSASAGSGKTKLLIDRLLRLMLPRVGHDPETGDRIVLPGSDPGRILCLTFTKAAAAEMAIRLQNTLGAWVSLPDAMLDAALAALDVPQGPDVRAAARALFARVLDLPGGMRIGTIHAFCQSLLRRFPLEAAVNPRFTLLEETDGQMALLDAAETALAQGEGLPVGRLAVETGLADFVGRIASLRHERAAVEVVLQQLALWPAQVEAAYGAVLGCGDATQADLARQAALPPQEADLAALLRVAAAEGPPTVVARATTQLDWLGTEPAARDLDIWRASLLTTTGSPRVRGGITKKLDTKCPEIGDALLAEAERQMTLMETGNALELRDLNLALLSLAGPALARFDAGKAARGLVDYDDLIAHTRALLADPGAAWVLYKLDGGIDHLLLDEVQDTSAAQWEIAGALTTEFFAGEGARDEPVTPRTVFAVGDSKQSIYAFQGADPDGFLEWRKRFEETVSQGGQKFLTPKLQVSFRSVEPVLNLVDRVFAHVPASIGVAEPGGGAIPEHISARPGQGGRVELWPLAPAETAMEEASPWSAPSVNLGQQSAAQRLADTLAHWIAAQIGKPPQPGQMPLRAGDVLVLVPRRSTFVTALVRALKGCDVPVATLVRVELKDQIAVRDLMALCDALLLPQDDLTLACVLTSPLGGLDDESLMALALDRKGQPLWSTLRARHAERADWRRVWRMLERLFSRVDYASPYDILAEVLGPLGGRARLAQRLGQEANEPVDELLSAALRYEGLHPPSLQGFLHWLRASETTIKREPEAQEDAVRVMTVHGAKGLQARLVILPDTTARARTDNPLLWTEHAGLRLPIWQPRAALGVALTQGLREKLAQAQAHERNRLLYVALTRAADWLVVCGWEPAGELADESWYAAIKKGFGDLSARRVPCDLGWGDDTLVHEVLPERVVPPASPQSGRVVASLPSWLVEQPKDRVPAMVHEPALTRPLAPSRPEQAAFGPKPAARSPLSLRGSTPGRPSALRRGVLIHTLLQALPEIAPDERLQAAWDFLARANLGLDADVLQHLADQALSVLNHPDLGPVFGPGSRAEQGITGIVAGSVVLGQVDRLRITTEAIYLCDYKSNQSPPRSIDTVPETYLRQMAAYAAVLSEVAPGRPVHAWLVWTETGALTRLAPDVLARFVTRT